MGHFSSSLLPLKYTYLKVLDGLHLHYPDACIAGGALRDLVFGGPVKDIDVFVPFNPDLDIQAVAQNAGWYPRSAFGLRGYQIGARAEVLAVYSYDVPGVPYEVQVILFVPVGAEHFMTQVTRRMDFDACQIASNGTVTYTTLDFDVAKATRTFKLINCLDAKQAERSLRRAERFAAKYPEIPIDVSLAHEVIKSTQEGLV